LNFFPSSSTAGNVYDVAGTLAVSLWTTPSGVTAYKGQSYDLAGYKLQASASDMSVTSISIDFDTRFWLYASAITLKDETGAVVGSISGLNVSNFSELTVGKDYRVSVPTNFVVKATQSKYITVNATFLGYTDRPTGPLNIVKAQIRSVDGTGVTDTQTISDVRQFSFQGSNIGQLVVTTDNSSPTAGTVQVSTAAQTQDVVLAIYDLKSQNQSATLQSLNVGLTFSTPSPAYGQILSSLKLKSGGLTYSADKISSTTATFTNMQIPLAADTYVPVTVYATFAADTNNVYDNVTLSTTLNTTDTNNYSVIDSTYTNVTATGATLTSNVLSLSASGLAFNNLSAPASVTASRVQGASSTASFNMSYTLTAGNNPIYVSKTYGTAITATTTGGAVFTNASFVDNDATNDGSTYFYIAPGQSKTFTSVISVVGASGTAGTYKISGINYGTGVSGTGASLTSSTIGGTLYTVATGF